MLLPFVIALGAIAADTALLDQGLSPVAEPIAAGIPSAAPAPLDLGSLLDALPSAEGEQLAKPVRRTPSKRTPVRRAPTKRPAPTKKADPLTVGLAGAGGAAIGATVGAIGIGVAGAFATGLAGDQPIEVVIATGALGIGIAIATPFMAGLGGGAGVLLADDRSRPEEWQGLLQCAASGYCAGLAAVAGPILGGGVACAPQSCLNLPGPDRPAEWTAGAAIAGLVAGGLVGVVGGYTLATDKTDPALPIGVGAFSGAILGSAVSAGLAGGVATMTRQ